MSQEKLELAQEQPPDKFKAPKHSAILINTLLDILAAAVQVGLEKLEFTEKQVAVMQQELEALQPSLIQTVAETEALMAQVW